MLRCRCGEILIKVETKESTVFVCPSYGDDEAHDIVIARKK